MSMTKLETPLRMTVEEANKEFYPNFYIMINCDVDMGAAIAGDVIAYAPLKRKGSLVDYMDELTLSSSFGEVRMRDTTDPLDGGSLLIEYYASN